MTGAEIDTIYDLREFVNEHLKGAVVTEIDGEIVIKTRSTVSMGGYLEPLEEEE